MKKIFTVSAFLFFISCLPASAQDIHFSQYNLTPLLVNPAQAGAYHMHEGIINYKSQWSSLSSDAFKTMMASYSGRFMQEKWKTSWLAGGVNFFSDKAGIAGMKTVQGNLHVGYHTQINNFNSIGGALMCGFAQRSVDNSQLKFEEQYVNGVFSANHSSGENFSNASFGYLDLGLGVLYRFSNEQQRGKSNNMFVLNVGASATHINKPAYSFIGSGEKLYTKITAHLDATVGFGKSGFGLMPSFLFMTQGPATEMLPGLYIRYKSAPSKGASKDNSGVIVMLGSHLRLKDAFIPSLQVQFMEYTLGLCYDMTLLSDLKTPTSGKGGIEVSVRYGLSPSGGRASSSIR